MVRCTEHGIEHANRECPICQLEGVVTMISTRLQKLEDQRLHSRLVILEKTEGARLGDR